MQNQVYKKWLHDWQWILQVAESRQWDIQTPLSVLPPCSVADLEEIAKEISLIIPEEFIQVATEFSAGVSFSWFMSEDDQEYVDDIFSGGADPLWSIEALKTCKAVYDGWIAECFPNPLDEYDRVWHNKTPFISVANGDMIAFNIFKGNRGCPVIYLSHDGDDDAHGKVLGQNFTDFISRWSQIGCPGTEFWQMQPFYNNDTHGIDPNGSFSNAWKQWINTTASIK